MHIVTMAIEAYSLLNHPMTILRKSNCISSCGMDCIPIVILTVTYTEVQELLGSCGRLSVKS